MNSNVTNPLHQPETEFHGELQVFSGPALAPDDPSALPRVRKGRPADLKKPAGTDNNEKPTQE
jgi:hypothetical protein